MSPSPSLDTVQLTITAEPASVCAGAVPVRKGKKVTPQGKTALGGDNPGNHTTLVGRRLYGFRSSGRSYVTVEGFNVVRTEDRGIYFTNASNFGVARSNTVSNAFRYGIAVDASVGALVELNTVSYGQDHGIALTGETVPGWASTLAVITFLFGVLFVVIGVMGLYIARIYALLQKRPTFIVAEMIDSADGDAVPGAAMAGSLGDLPRKS